MEIVQMTLENIKNSDGWAEMCFALGHDYDKCSEMFEYGEYGTIRIEVDENFNIVGGKIIKTGK